MDGALISDMNLSANIPFRVASFQSDTVGSPTASTSGNFIQFGNGNNRAKQLAIDNSGNVTFRLHNGSSWQPWQKLSTE